MYDIRKRLGAKGTTYQVRYPSKTAKTGYAYKTFDTRKEAQAFIESGRTRDGSQSNTSIIRTVQQATDTRLKICEKEGLNGRERAARLARVSIASLDDYWDRSSRS